MNNEISIQKKEILQSLGSTEYLPSKQDVDLSLENVTKMPLSTIGAMGVAFEPLTQAIQFATSKSGGSGLYFVNTHGKEMFHKQGQSGFIGSLQTVTGMVGGGQADILALPCNPTMLFMASALISIEKKLDSIEEAQAEMMEFLKQKEKSKLRGNLNVLNDILNNYKFNWNKDTYKTNKHIQVQEIKRDAEQSIILYREEIAKKIRKRSKIHSDQDIKKAIEEMQLSFKDYQLALYLYSFSAFLEVMLLENFDAGYLDSVANRIEEYAFQYRSLYTNCYNLMEERSKSTIQSILLNKASSSTEVIRKAIEKIPVISKSPLDENLIDASRKLKAKNEGKAAHSLEKLVDAKTNVVVPFIQNIKKINALYNQPVEFYFDKQNLYVKQLTE